MPRNLRTSVIGAALLLSVAALVWFALPLRVGNASHGAIVTAVVAPAATSLPPPPDLRSALAPNRHAALLRQDAEQVKQLAALHSTLWLHARGAELLTAWNAPATLKAVNWYGFEYAPFVAEGLDRLPLDDILATIRRLGFNAIRLTFADETVESNPVVTTELKANPQLRGLHSLDIMQRLIERADDFGIRIILCNSRSEGGRGPETKTGLWYTRRYPVNAWYSDWETLAKRFRNDDAFVGADLRNEPHIIGSLFTEQAYFEHGPLWGAYHGVYYHDRDWHWAAETLGNDLLAINPHLLIIVEGVQMYLDPFRNVMTGGLWGSNLTGVQYDPIVLSRPGQLVYSVHEYGPHTWQANWFNPKTTYRKMARRWGRRWGYLLTASKLLQAPIFVGEFGTCHEYAACVSSDEGWKQGFWFKSFVRYLGHHPQVGWAYWSLNPTGPFNPGDENSYSLLSTNWQHYYPLLAHGVGPILREPNGLWNQTIPPSRAATPMHGCFTDRSCLPGVDSPPATSQANAVPTVVSIHLVRSVSYAGANDPQRTGDLYLPQDAGLSRPAVIIVHGRTWSEGGKGSPETAGLAAALARHGYVTYDIDYRLAGQGGGYPRDIRDVRSAAVFLTVNAARYGIDSSKIAVIGNGAGGYLALMAAYAPQTGEFEPRSIAGIPVRFAAVASFFAPIHLPDVAASPGADIVGDMQSYLGQYAADLKAASPDTYVDQGVPTILFSGLTDPDAPFRDDFQLYKGLRQRSVHAQLIDLPGSPHALSALSPFYRREAVLQITRFFDDVFHPPQEKASS